jgi:hypothetical protein
MSGWFIRQVNEEKGVWAQSYEMLGTCCDSCGQPRGQNLFSVQAGRTRRADLPRGFVATREEAVAWCSKKIAELEEELKQETAMVEARNAAVAQTKEEEDDHG